MTGSRIGLAAVLLAVLGLVVVARPDDDSGGPAGDGVGEPAEQGVLPSATPTAPPSEEAFCEAYRTLAGMQGQYAAQPDATGAELLRAAADDLIATGVPDTMRPGARAGYFVEISGIYTSLGEALDPRAVPGAEDGVPADGASREFGTWLAQFCPAW